MSMLTEPFSSATRMDESISNNVEKSVDVNSKHIMVKNGTTESGQKSQNTKQQTNDQQWNISSWTQPTPQRLITPTLYNLACLPYYQMPAFSFSGLYYLVPVTGYWYL